jgi:DNA-binding NtrC family response regulator
MLPPTFRVGGQASDTACRYWFVSISSSRIAMVTPTRVLIVDADGTGAPALLQLLAAAGFETSHAAGVDRAVDMLLRSGTDVVLLALGRPGLRGVSQLAAAAGDAQLVLFAPPGQEVTAREGLRLGACDVIDHTRDMNTLLLALERAAHEARLRREVAALRARLGEETEQALVGRSEGMRRVRELVGRAAATRRTVLVTGEPGAGKDVVARLVHELSDRVGGPFVVVRCSDGGEAALEAELFGDARGGLLESARGGTLVLDDVAAFPRSLRERLARLLAERVVHRSGADDDVQVDVRLVLTARASECDGEHVAGLFGERNALPIALPPLRERRTDIPLLVQHFRARIARDTGMTLPPITPHVMTPLLAHEWPGNVRELETWVERLAYTTASSAGGAGASTTPHPVGPSADFARLDAARVTLEELERRYVLHVYEQERGHQRRCAERLGIDRRTLYRKLKEYREDGEEIRRIG